MENYFSDSRIIKINHNIWFSINRNLDCSFSWGDTSISVLYCVFMLSLKVFFDVIIIWTIISNQYWSKSWGMFCFLLLHGDYLILNTTQEVSYLWDLAIFVYIDIFIVMESPPIDFYVFTKCMHFSTLVQ